MTATNTGGAFPIYQGSPFDPAQPATPPSEFQMAKSKCQMRSEPQTPKAGSALLASTSLSTAIIRNQAFPLKSIRGDTQTYEEKQTSAGRLSPSFASGTSGPSAALVPRPAPDGAGPRTRSLQGKGQQSRGACCQQDLGRGVSGLARLENPEPTGGISSAEPGAASQLRHYRPSTVGWFGPLHRIGHSE